MTLLLVPSLRAGLLLGIGKGRSGNQVDGIGGLITRNEALIDALVHGAIRRAGLVRKAGKVLLDEVFPEVFARVSGHDFLAQLRRIYAYSLFQLNTHTTPGSQRLPAASWNVLKFTNWSDD